jgi:DNA-binding transcriptional regulator GbsR (MarR family)
MDQLKEARIRLVETGGRTSQDLGAGRIVGQVLVFLYLQENECSLDLIGDELGLSKASVSIAARQLETLGLVREVWKAGDRKNYYRSADNIANALQQGILSVVRNKVQLFGNELDASLAIIDQTDKSKINAEAEFLRKRVTRAKKLQNRLDAFLRNPLVKFFTQPKDQKQ